MATITLSPREQAPPFPATTEPPAGVGSTPQEATVPPAEADPSWAKPCLIALLVGTALLYLWALGDSGWANSFYSAAVQAGTKSWRAFFFGSSDASNFITVDKPPASLWVMEISARIFGVNSWSILVPQALEGVAAVGVLYAAVKRWFGAGAGLIAGLVLALTPAAALMFRFNNPDALLTLLLVGSAYALTRAIERGNTLWLVTAGALIGFGFLTKMLQAFLVVPGFTLVYLVAANAPLRRRIWQVAIAAVAVLVSSFWWVVAVMAVPASSRPFIGGSQNNSLWDLIFGYNGFGRLTGSETGSVGGRGQAGSMWGPTGWTRMFNDAFGGQIAWLLPAALILMVAVFAMTWRAPRTDRARAGMALWGSWLVFTGLVLSLGQGIIHPYYVVVLGPAIGAVVGIGVTYLWRRRHDPMCRATLATTLVATAVCSLVLLHRTPDWQPWLAPTIFVGGLAVAAALLVGPWVFGRAGQAIAAAGIVVALAGSGAYAFATASTPHSGSIPSAGPTVAASFGGPGGGFAGAGPGGFAGAGPGGRVGGGAGGGGAQGFPGAPAGGAAGGAGGLLDGSTPSAALTQLLEQGAGNYTWVAATVGSNSGSGYQLATNDPVMSIGGFNGTDPSPTLAQFQSYVEAGDIHYFIAGGGGFGRGGFGGGGGGGASTSSQITTYVERNFTSTTVGNITVYDLTSPRN
ncbi:MAG TPA: glycosyltransferase family 39 protein [Acidimicrobiales bacterium]